MKNFKTFIFFVVFIVFMTVSCSSGGNKTNNSGDTEDKISGRYEDESGHYYFELNCKISQSTIDVIYDLVGDEPPFAISGLGTFYYRDENGEEQNNILCPFTVSGSTIIFDDEYDDAHRTKVTLYDNTLIDPTGRVYTKVVEKQENSDDI